MHPGKDSDVVGSHGGCGDGSCRWIGRGLVASGAVHGELRECVGERGWDEHWQEGVDSGSAVGGLVLIVELGACKDKDVVWVHGAAGETWEEADDDRKERCEGFDEGHVVGRVANGHGRRIHEESGEMWDCKEADLLDEGINVFVAFNDGCFAYCLGCTNR